MLSLDNYWLEDRELKAAQEENTGDWDSRMLAISARFAHADVARDEQWTMRRRIRRFFRPVMRYFRRGLHAR